MGFIDYRNNLNYFDKHFWVANIFFTLIASCLFIIAILGLLVTSSVNDFLKLKNQWITTQNNLTHTIITYDLENDPKHLLLARKKLAELEILSSGIENIISDKKISQEERQTFHDISGLDGYSTQLMSTLFTIVQKMTDIDSAMSSKREQDQLMASVDQYLQDIKRNSSSFKEGNISEYFLDISRRMDILNIKIQESADSSFKWLTSTAYLLIFILGGSLVIVGLISSYYFYRKLKIWNDSLKNSLENKKALMMEIHHRVKNNLAIITGLMELQEDKLEDNEAKDAIIDSKNRIHTMAMAQELLYKTGSLNKIDLRNYVKELVNLIKRTSSNAGRRISFHFNLDSILIQSKRATSIGLLLNEIITNSIKHAFKGKEKGNIYIKVKEIDNNELCIEIQDDGIGIPDIKNIFNNTDSLGIKLIQNIVIQLDGNIEFQSDKNNGTTVTIHCPVYIEKQFNFNNEF